MAPVLRPALPLLADLPSAPADPCAGTPPRAPGSVRRTASWDVTWPAGTSGEMQVDAALRDLATGDAGRAEPLAVAGLRVLVDRARQVVALTADPVVPELSALVGARGGSGFRARLAELPAADPATPAGLLLDDLPGVTLVGPYAWRYRPQAAGSLARGEGLQRSAAAVAGVCTGFRADGPPAQRLLRGEDLQQSLVPAPDLADPGDPLAWHALPAHEPGTTRFRRRRRVDVAPRADGALVAEAFFRDSIWTPDGVETVVHEYLVTAVVDPVARRLTEVAAQPRVLPFGTCPAAADQVAALAGEPVPELRRRVAAVLPGVAGCTHLNDALRGLAEVPALAGQARPPRAAPKR
ncbi:DUF2889 domain-containing protein [Blastococcus sp. SYSU D00820]